MPKKSKKELYHECELDDIKFFLNRRRCHLDQLVNLLCKRYPQKQGKRPRKPLFDCLIMVQLYVDTSIAAAKPFIKMKFPVSVTKCINSKKK